MLTSVGNPSVVRAGAHSLNTSLYQGDAGSEGPSKMLLYRLPACVRKHGLWIPHIERRTCAFLGGDYQ